MSNVFALTQRAYRFFNDDGSETTATVAAAENTALTKSINAANPRMVLRISLAETGAGSISGASTDDYQLQYSYDGGAYTNVTTSSSVVKGYDSSNLTNDGATTDNANLSNAGSGSFVAGEVSEDGLVDNLQITANNFTELLFTLEIVHADVAHGKNIDFRVLLNGATTNMTYTVTPRITVSDTERYWVGGTDTWNATAGSKWSWWTGGTAGASVPTSTLDAYFDGNSTGTITVGGSDSSICKNLSFSGFAGTVTSPNLNINIHGNLTLDPDVTYTSASQYGVFRLTGTANTTITNNGANVGAWKFSCYKDSNTASATFQDAFLTDGEVRGTRGVLDLNDVSGTCGSLRYQDDGLVCEIKLGNGTTTVGTATAQGSVNFNGASLTLTPEGSTIVLKNIFNFNGLDFPGGGKTFNVVQIGESLSGSMTISGSNTFATLEFTKNGQTYKFTDGTTTTITGDFDPDGASGQVNTVTGTSTGGWTISKASGTIDINYVTLSYSTATGGATWNAYTTNGNTNGGNNSGWNFSAPVADAQVHLLAGKFSGKLEGKFA